MISWAKRTGKQKKITNLNYFHPIHEQFTAIRVKQQKKHTPQWRVPLFCDSGGIQTPNLLIRSQLLYSVKLRSRFKNRLQRYNLFFNWQKRISFFLPKPFYFSDNQNIKNHIFLRPQDVFRIVFPKIGSGKRQFRHWKSQKKRDIQKLLPTCKIRNKIVTLQCRFVCYLSKGLRK